MKKTDWEPLRLSTAPTDRFVYFVCCREVARINKEELGLPQPWVRDPILQTYRFCNVDREDDAVTRWVAHTVRNCQQLHSDFVLMAANLAVARLFNQPSTLEECLPIFSLADVKQLCGKMQAKKESGKAVFRGAYMVAPHGPKGKGVKTTAYIHTITNNLLNTLPDTVPGTLAELAECMLKAYGWERFMVNQLVTDFRYTPYYPKDTTPDWTTFVMAGPGTRRGLQRWNGAEDIEDVRSMKNMKDAPTMLLEIRDELVTFYGDILGGDILSKFQDINNLSNCFCEFDKYERARIAFINKQPIRLRIYR